MITINKTNSTINVMKFTFIFMLLPLLVLLASFTKENKVYNRLTAGRSDTLVWAANAKFKTVKTISAYLELVQDKNEKILPVPANFLPNDPDESTPSPIPVTGASGSTRARTQLKAYLDSLIVDPKSPGLLKKQ